MFVVLIAPSLPGFLCSHGMFYKVYDGNNSFGNNFPNIVWTQARDWDP